MDPEAFYRLINTRRDVRGQFTGEPLDPEKLGRILAAAHAAPSVGMSQPWGFVIVDSPATKREFHDHVMAERAAYDATLSEDRRQTFSKIKIEGILEATYGIVVSYDPDRGAPSVLGRHSIPDAGLYSVCLAIENLWLAATLEEIGVGWVSFYREEYLAKLVGMPERLRPIAWLCVGPVSHFEAVPDLEKLEWRSRSPLSEHVYHDRYGDGDGVSGLAAIAPPPARATGAS